jgi:hypothetical protein
LNATLSNLLFVLALLLLLVAGIGFQILRMRRAPLGRVMSILTDIRRNEELVAGFGSRRGAGRLRAGAWQKNRNRVGFLPHEMLEALTRLFSMVDEINRQIDAFGKHQDAGYLAGIDVSRLREPLARSREQLKGWLQENMHDPKYRPKKYGLSGLFRR